jgi:hypothetical protein
MLDQQSVSMKQVGSRLNADRIREKRQIQTVYQTFEPQPGWGQSSTLIRILRGCLFGVRPVLGNP